ncbi:MAG: homoserine O-succinyltransferase, partial [Rhodobacteraceae bacterium]|nr:homoserine O-succinyltransferase [Paracoccaceae bacterium]
SQLPAHTILAREGVMVMSRTQAARQDIRPLEIGLLNLMPDKPTTETQFARLIGATPLQIRMTLIRMTHHKSRHTTEKHMGEFYRSFAEIRADGQKFDGLIITGAPIELMDYESVGYWDEFCEVLEWLPGHIHAAIGVCWAGMAMLYAWHGLSKHRMPAKASGCYRHRATQRGIPILRGLNDEFVMPVSRWTSLSSAEIAAHDDLEVLIEPLGRDAGMVGPCLVADSSRRTLMIMNHFEYDWDTLKKEYVRDREKEASTPIPRDYFPDDDSSKIPQNRWRCHGHQFYGNWINEIYQATPFDPEAIGQGPGTALCT